MERTMRTRTVVTGVALLLLLMPSCDSGSRDSGRGTKELPPLVFMADKDVLGTVELYLSSEAGTRIKKLSGPMVAGGNVEACEWETKGLGIAYLADQDQIKVLELYISLPDGSDNAKASGFLVPGGNVRKFAWTY